MVEQGKRGPALISKDLRSLALAIVLWTSAGSLGAAPGGVCLDKVYAGAWFGGAYFAGTPAGLFAIENETLKASRVAQIESRPVIALERVSGSLRVQLASGEAFLCKGWIPEELQFRRIKSETVSVKEILPELLEGHLITGEVTVHSQKFRSTAGGGLYQDIQESWTKVDNAPSWILSLALGKEDEVLLSSREGLVARTLDGKSSMILKGDAEDCRITSVARWRGAVYASTLSGGTLRVADYSSFGGLSGLAQRVNCLETWKGGLYAGTEKGLFRYQKNSWTPSGLTLAVKAMAQDAHTLWLTTPVGTFSLSGAGLPAAYRYDIKGPVLAVTKDEVLTAGMYGLWSLVSPHKPVRRLYEYITGLAWWQGEPYASGYYSGLWKRGSNGWTQLCTGAFSCMAAGEKVLWLGTGGQGLFAFGGPKASLQQVGGLELPSSEITSLRVDQGSLLIGTMAGVLVQDEKTVKF